MNAARKLADYGSDPINHYDTVTISDSVGAGLSVCTCLAYGANYRTVEYGKNFMQILSSYT